VGQSLIESELTESRAFIEFFAQKIVVSPDGGVQYPIPMPHDGWVPGKDAEEVALHNPVLSSVQSGGPRTRAHLRFSSG
jgi:hypothetical protein